MTPPTQIFVDDALAAANGLRMLVHAMRMREDSVATGPHGDGVVARVEAHQCVVEMAYGAEGLRMRMRPRPGLENGQRDVDVVLPAAFVGPAGLADALASDPASLPAMVAEGLGRVLANGRLDAFEHDGLEHCVIGAVVDGDRLLAFQRVEAITRGIDALTGLSTTLTTHPFLGMRASVVPLTADGLVAAVPGDDEPNQERRAAGARLRMADAWSGVLPDAFTLRRLPGDAGAFTIEPHALTIMAPSTMDERRAALSASIAAYMALAAAGEPPR